MAKLYNLARVTTATVGTGTITLGAAASGYLTFALAGVSNGEVVSYGIRDGANSETGTGTYTSAGTTLTRTVTKSTNSNTAISLSGTAEVFITPRAEDLANLGQANAFTDATAASSTTTGAITIAGGLGVAGKGYFGSSVVPVVVPTTAWAFDGTSNTITLANGATATLPAGAGLILIGDGAITGITAAFLAGGGATVMLGQSNGSAFVASSSPSAGLVGVYCSGGATYLVKNNQGGSITLSITLIRVTPA